MREIKLCEIGDRGSSNQKSPRRRGIFTISQRINKPIISRRGSFFNFEAAMKASIEDDTISEKIYMAKKNYLLEKKR
jgi:hypothetical protein